MKIDSKAIEAHFQIPADVARLASLASWDLHYGPLTSCETCGADSLADCECEARYPGFVQACREVAAWVEENVSTLYLDAESGFVSDRQPAEDFDDCPSCDGSGTDPDDEGYPCSKPGCSDGLVLIEPDERWYEIDQRQVVAVLFGEELSTYLR
jgi:hypothetical protein